jgi:xanthine dehydrogenase accessory factor
MRPDLCLLRGGGDLATGVAWRLTRAGWPVVVCELARPLTVRRNVALSTAVTAGRVDIEGMIGRLAQDPTEAIQIAAGGDVGVIVSPKLPDVAADVVIDARLAKRNIDTHIDDADLVIGIGPGFTAGVDCHAVVETMRGHHLGRVIWSGRPAADTGTPGEVEGRAAERVLRAPAHGTVRWQRRIGEIADEGDLLGHVADEIVRAPFRGVIRGLIADGSEVGDGLKIGDLDPRADPSQCHEISDKALAVGGGALEAVLTWLHQSG